MSEAPIQPGLIWKCNALSPEFFIDRWESEIHTYSPGHDMVDIAFSASIWDDWKWNAGEALHLNRKWQASPKVFRHLFLPQNMINLYLLRAHRELITSWRQWAGLPKVHGLPILHETHNPTFLTLSAMGRIDQAKLKHESLVEKKKSLQVFSLRQQRFYQNLTAIYLDLSPLIKIAVQYGESVDPDNPDLSGLEEDIDWHVKELQRLVGPVNYRPELASRVRSPRIEINRLLGMLCLYHLRFLRTIIKL